MADGIQYPLISDEVTLKIQNLYGPIMIFGAGGFIGTNLILSLLLHRKDVIGISHNPKKNKRLSAAHVPEKYLEECDITDKNQLKKIIEKFKPQTIFNLAAYGAYPFQSDIQRIYSVNFDASIALIELLKKNPCSVYVYAGSQSEYGSNNAAPKESAALSPNSHYAVSKTAAYFAHRYYKQSENLPIFHLRFYSVYGPWEEPSRLIPTLIKQGTQGGYPPLVHAAISRDFIYISDAVAALIHTAANKKHHMLNNVFNIGTGKKTSIKQLVYTVKKILKIKNNPEFSTMTKRPWDTSTDWYAYTKTSTDILEWSAHIKLKEGLKKTIVWHNSMLYEKNNVFDYSSNL